MLAEGLAYSPGALAYALRRPDPWRSLFGFHEVFHALHRRDFRRQYVGTSLLAYSIGPKRAEAARSSSP
jgi:hemolysin III